VLASEHLAVKKPGGGIPASRMAELIGGRLRRAIKADEPLRFEDL
jgi:sialic acid synthase SpsE